MNSVGSSSGDDKTDCPKCTQFIERVEMMAFRVDAIRYQMQEISKFLAENEWVFIENAEKLRQIKNFDRDVDQKSFEMTNSQIIRFNRYIDKVKRALTSIDAEGENFSRGG
jgi:hypothetical protein